MVDTDRLIISILLFRASKFVRVILMNRNIPYECIATTETQSAMQILSKTLHVVVVNIPCDDSYEIDALYFKKLSSFFVGFKGKEFKEYIIEEYNRKNYIRKLDIYQCVMLKIAKKKVLFYRR